LIKGDPIIKVLYVDLSRRRFWVKERPDLFSKYFGGTGVAIQLLHEECPPNIHPFDSTNPIIFAVGQLNGLFPLASKTVAMFKSPLTGNLGESHCGGRSSIAIRMAGYGAIVIKGKSETPVYLAIHGDEVYFRDASAIWGIADSYTVGRIIRELETGAGVRTIMRIGLAGEKLVSYACVVTETYRHFGRLGLGAVFGSKKLKALVISGRRSIKPEKPKLYREIYKEIFEKATKLPLMRKYHELGTAMNVNPLNELGGLPTRNLKNTKFEAAENISGESFAEKFLGRRVACAHCPVSCIHIAALREPYETEPYFYKTKMISYDYELIYALGSMLGVDSIEKLLRLIDEVETLGLDAMSTGVVLAWITEMQEKGLIGEKETEGLKFRWGDYATYLKAIRFIVTQPNEFYKDLAKGVEYAALKHGGLEFALAFGGNEMPGYHTGPAAHVGYLTGSRHSHLDSAGYSVDEKAAASKKKLNAEEVGKMLFEEERWRQILSSLVVCFFARGVYTPEVVIKALTVVGYELNVKDLERIGERILKSKYEFKVREGFDLKKLRIPKRILETPTPHGFISEEFIKEAVKAYKNRIEKIEA
jgi:aldehyde:ferredoxin oxidoreductase